MIKKLKAALAVAALLAFAIACGAGGDSATAEPDNAAPVTNPVEPDSVTPVTNPVEPDSVTPVTNPVEPDSVTPVTNPVEPDSVTPTPKVVWVVQWPDSWPVPPLPVMWLEHESGPTRGSPQSYCWQLENAV